MFTNTKINILFFLILSTLPCCQEVPNFPLEPVLKSGNLSFIPSVNSNEKIRLNLTFTDGDGDLGLTSADTNGQFKPNFVNKIPTNANYFNISIKFLFKDSVGNFRECSQINGCLDSLRENLTELNPNTTIGRIDTILKSYNGRFPRLGPDERKRPISGNLIYDIESPNFSILFKNITFKIETSIKDRELNQSNNITTDSIRLK